MDNLFIIQLITSFVVGGSVITIISLIAERVSKNMAGLILAFPSTVSLGFFFLGWTLSAEAVSEITPSTLIPLGLSPFAVIFYCYIAEYSTKITSSRIKQIIVSFTACVSLWLILAIPIAVFQLNNLLVGTIVYLLLISIAHFFLNKRSYEKPKRITYSLAQKIGRATFVGFMIFLVVLFGKILNPFWGGVFTMFPAVFSSVMVLLHWYYGPESLFPTMQKAPVGTLSLYAYVITVMFVFPEFGFIWGTMIAYISSTIVTLLLMKFQSENI